MRALDNERRVTISALPAERQGLWLGLKTWNSPLVALPDAGTPPCSCDPVVAIGGARPGSGVHRSLTAVSYGAFIGRAWLSFPSPRATAQSAPPLNLQPDPMAKL